MQGVWDMGPSSVEAVHEVVSRKRDLKETSVRTILRRLEQKGYLRHKEEGRAYVYRAAELLLAASLPARCGRSSTAFARVRSRNWSAEWSKPRC